MKNLQKFIYRKNETKPEFPYLELSDNPKFKVYIYLLIEKDVDSDEYSSFFKHFSSKYNMIKQNFQAILNRINDQIPDYTVLEDGQEIIIMKRSGRTAKSLVPGHIDRSITRRDNSFIVSIRSKKGEYLSCKSFKMKFYTIDFIREFRNKMEKYIENASENVIKEDIKKEFERVLQEMDTTESKKR